MKVGQTPGYFSKLLNRTSGNSGGGILTGGAFLLVPAVLLLVGSQTPSPLFSRESKPEPSGKKTVENDRKTVRAPRRNTTRLDCQALLLRARNAPSSQLRVAALLALGGCPADDGPAGEGLGPQIRSLFSETLYLGDIYERRATLRALRPHLKIDLLPRLLQVYHRDWPAGFNQREWALLYEYLQILARPEDRSDLVRVFRRGLYGQENASHRHNVRPHMGARGYNQERHRRELDIRVQSLLGLGKIQARTEWPRIEYFIRSPWPRIQAAALRSGARLNFARTQDFALAGKYADYLYHPAYEVQNAAIEFMDSLRSIRATENLIVLYAFQSPPPQYDVTRLQRPNPWASLDPVRKLIYESAWKRKKAPTPNPRLKGLGEIIKNRLVRLGPYPGRPGVIRQVARLRREPTEPAPILRVLGERSVVYRNAAHNDNNATKKDYRLAPGFYRRGATAPWSPVILGDGDNGWVHGSRVEFLSF